MQFPKAMPESLHLPMTYDRDSEIMQHATLSNHLKINIYFANLHAP
jgi:IS30 family transposase